MNPGSVRRDRHRLDRFCADLARPQAVGRCCANFRISTTAERRLPESILDAREKAGQHKRPAADHAAGLIHGGRNVAIDDIQGGAASSSRSEDEAMSDLDDAGIAAGRERLGRLALSRRHLRGTLFICCHSRRVPATQQIALALRIVSA